MKVREEKGKTLLWGMIVMIMAVITFVYWGQKKEIWFCDEVYSYESANGFEQAWPATYVDEWMSGKDVEKFFSADSDKLSLNDITVRLYSDHVPLYFWLFRMVSFLGFHGSGTIWIGLSINLLFYICVVWLAYWMFLKLMKNSFGAAIIVLLSCITNRLMLEQATTLRMYIMLLCEELLLVLAGMWILHRKDEGKLSVGAFICLFLSSLAGFLTHYDFWIFYAATAAVFCMWLLGQAIRSGRFWRTIELKVILVWIGNFVSSLLLTIMIFPYCRWNLNRGKGELALQSLFVFSKEKLDHILWGYERQSISVFGEKFPIGLGLVIMFGCIIGGAIVLYKNKETGKMVNLILVVLVCQVYQLIVCFTFPAAAEERYLWGTFSLMVWCMLYGAYEVLQAIVAMMKQERVRKVSERILVVVLAFAFTMSQFMAIDGGRGISYLFNVDKDMDLLEAHADIPWVVYGSVMDAYSYYDILIPEQICFLTENNTYEDAKIISEMTDKEQFVLYTTEEFYPQAIKFFSETFESEVTGEYLMRSVNLQVYLLNVSEK